MIQICQLVPQPERLRRSRGISNISMTWKSDFTFLFFFPKETNNYHRLIYMQFRAHQTHYEQMGFLYGDIKMEEFDWIVQKMPSFRDHSFGKQILRNCLLFFCQLRQLPKETPCYLFYTSTISIIKSIHCSQTISIRFFL